MLEVLRDHNEIGGFFLKFFFYVCLMSKYLELHI